MRYLTLIMFVIAPLIGGSQTDEPMIEPDSVIQYILDADLEHKDIIVAQAILETGWFRCTGCSMRNDNNLFGWYYKGRYLEFATWQESVDYYVWWQDQHYKGGDYYKFLVKVGFATAKDYVKTLKKIKVKFNKDE